MSQELVKQFHEKFGLTINDKPTIPDQKTIALRISLILEEMAEFVEAAQEGDIVGVADGLADLLYVTYGAGVTFGIDLEKVLAEVHRSNMTKLWEDGTVHRREDGKILKPPTYSPADIKKALE